MIHPKRDFLIALALTLSGFTALAFGLFRLSQFGGNDTMGGIAAVIGGLVAFFSLFILFNFLWALKLSRRILRGEGVIARWTVLAPTVDAYLAAEKARPRWDRSRWRPRAGVAADILFTADGVLAGGRYHGLQSSGTQHFTAVQSVPGNPILIQFDAREITATTNDSLAWFASVLRLPIARGAEDQAAKVLAHFSSVLRGETLVKPDFWTKRIRIGKVSIVLGLVSGLVGWALAKISGWQINDTPGMTAMILMIAGVFFVLVGAPVWLFSAAFRRQQRGQR
jgi:hypothetical protein